MKNAVFPPFSGFELCVNFYAAEAETYLVAQSGIVYQLLQNGVQSKVEFTHITDDFGLFARKTFYEYAFPFWRCYQLKFEVGVERKFFSVKITVFIQYAPQQKLFVIG